MPYIVLKEIPMTAFDLFFFKTQSPSIKLCTCVLSCILHMMKLLSYVKIGRMQVDVPTKTGEI